MTDGYLTLTPAGVFYAFVEQSPSEKAQALQALLAHKSSLSVAKWVAHYGHEWLDEFTEQNYIEKLSYPLLAPKMPLDQFLPYVVASLSGTRRAAIASSEGFCLAKIGYDGDEADRLCVAAADFFDFVSRQEQRGLSIAGRAVSLFNQVDLLMPQTSFVFLWIDEMGYVLIIDGEPLTNNRAFVELVWAIGGARLRYENPSEK